MKAGTACLLLLLAACLAGQQLPRAAAVAAPTKWTILVYMLADNNLEMFGLWDMEEIMAAMTTEPAGAGKCTTTACGASCPSSMMPTWTDGTSCSAGAKQTRCCDTATYPDVLVLVDKGRGAALSQHLFSMPHADYSLLDTQWATAKLLRALPGESTWRMYMLASIACLLQLQLQPSWSKVCCLRTSAEAFMASTVLKPTLCAEAHPCMPLACIPIHNAGGQWEHITEYAELNMASAATITDFVSYGLTRWVLGAGGHGLQMCDGKDTTVVMQ